jgi:serine/threonine-protein kinase
VSDPADDARLESLRAFASTFVQTARETVTPPREPPSEGSRAALAAFDELGDLLGARGARGLVAGATLGEGGMGVVRVARQVALDREVALKTLKDGERSRDATLDLLREAWVTGSLEHPNIVPVYDLAVDDRGGPAIVLKRIEGVAWSAVMRDAAAVRERFASEDLLEWNLRTLVTVSNALAFAHERGVVHRDLKPENVMLGRFGEVYLLDWGIAVTTRDGDARLPHARDAKAMAGTPHYMAPEMLGDGAHPVGAHSDVYLLGSTLHEILTGRPPHEGPSVMAILASVVRSECALPPELPEEIARVCRRAMARDPADRFPSAAAFREAVEAFLRHRGSLALAANAERHRARLSAARAEGAGAEAVHAILGECRFGYRAALEAWPENGAAKEGLDALLAEMIDYELERGNAEAAARLLAERSERSAAIAARVDEALAAAAQERARLGELDRDNDASIGRRTRIVLMLVLGTIWTLTPIAVHARPEVVTPGSFAASAFGMLALALALSFWARDSLRKTRLNLRLMGIVLVILALQAALALASLLGGAPLERTLALLPALFTMGSATTALWVDARTWPAPVVATVTMLTSVLAQEYAFLGVALYSLVQTVAIVAIWVRPSDLAPERG